MENTRSHNFKELYESDTKKKTKKNFFLLLILSLSLILSCIYIGYNILNIDKIVKCGYIVINFLFIIIIDLCLISVYKKTRNKNNKGIFSFFMNLSFILLLLVGLDLVHIPTFKTMKDFRGESISEALTWAEDNDIEVIQTYDNSDSIEEFHIISQSVKPDELLSNVDEVEFIISKGPDYNKEFILENLTGQNIDDVVKYIKKNNLSNVTINFEVNEEYKRDIVFKQNVTGEVKRSDEIVFTVSYGNDTNFGDIKMIDLKGLSKFDALLFLKRNALSYDIEYDFSDKYDKDYVMSQSIEKDKVVSSKDKIILTISKGSKIKVPDIKNMTQSEITKWVMENNLKIVFKERYDLDIEIGSIIDSDFKKDDTIEQGQTITVLISKGQLKFKDFSSVTDFKTWANENAITFTEEFEKSDTINKGEIIRFSVNKGDIINPFENIIITISSGSTTTIPNFVNKSKTEISKLCSSNKLSCSFYYVGYTSKSKDIATKQSKYAGSEVLEGTSVSIGLSSGIATSKPNIDTSKPTTTPPANNCKTKKFYIVLGPTVDQSIAMTKQTNPDFKIVFVTGNPGYGNTGSAYKESTAQYHDKEVSTCETVTIKLVQR